MKPQRSCTHWQELSATHWLSLDQYAWLKNYVIYVCISYQEATIWFDLVLTNDKDTDTFHLFQSATETSPIAVGGTRLLAKNLHVGFLPKEEAWHL